MSELETERLPAHLKPSKDNNDVRVPVEGVKLEENIVALAEFCKQVGLTKLTKATLGKLHNAGVAMENLGVTRLTQPSVLTAVHRMDKAMENIGETLEEEESPEEKARLAHAIGYLGGQLSRCASTINDAADEARADSDHRFKHRSKSFNPGAIVQVNVNAPSATVQLPDGTPTK